MKLTQIDRRQAKVLIEQEDLSTLLTGDSTFFSCAKSIVFVALHFLKEKTHFNPTGEKITARISYTEDIPISVLFTIHIPKAQRYYIKNKDVFYRLIRENANTISFLYRFSSLEDVIFLCHILKISLAHITSTLFLYHGCYYLQVCFYLHKKFSAHTIHLFHNLVCEYAKRIFDLNTLFLLEEYGVLLMKDTALFSICKYFKPHPTTFF